MTKREELYYWLKGLYPSICIDDVTSYTNDIEFARSHDRCEDSCPGVRACKTHGYRPVIRREPETIATYSFVLRFIPCSTIAAERKKIETQKINTCSALPERYKAASFENFITLKCDNMVRTAKSTAMECAQEGYSLVLLGPPGTGKTHLAAAMAADYIKRGKSAIFMPVISFLDTIKDGFGNQKAVKIEEAARNADFVAIDDLGAQKDTDWTTERLFEIIDYRYREKKPLVITTNAAKLGELSDMAGPRGPMIVSRMQDEDYGQVVILNKCRDYRSIRKKNTLL